MCAGHLSLPMGILVFHGGGNVQKEQSIKGYIPFGVFIPILL